ncbi:hypothetical protein THRCLA_04386 [Thraustotheca clavata]|uniref:RING-type domain-containing protein n=1 Tax=Thraustotheca clavata TaxID=74557 RepID=A0A1V9ZZX4_9STRA|nr:hypothetical protein THRCLA_04386 [Thraustotheca clavata]
MGIVPLSGFYAIYVLFAYVISFDVVATRMLQPLVGSLATELLVLVGKIIYIGIGIPALYTELIENASYSLTFLLWVPWSTIVYVVYCASLPLLTIAAYFKPEPHHESHLDDYKPMTQCAVCLEFLTTEKLAKYCDHCQVPCCVDCFNTYLEHSILNSKPLSCPGCASPLSSSIWSSIISDSTRALATAHCLNQDNTPTCPRCSQPSLKNNKLIKRRIECLNCHSSFCRECGKSFHLLRNCTDKAFIRYCREHDVRQCSTCSRLVQKPESSCNQLTCIKCFSSLRFDQLLPAF